jgi:hypothetical protein
MFVGCGHSVEAACFQLEQVQEFSAGFVRQKKSEEDATFC